MIGDLGSLSWMFWEEKFCIFLLSISSGESECLSLFCLCFCGWIHVHTYPQCMFVWRNKWRTMVRSESTNRLMGKRKTESHGNRQKQSWHHRIQRRKGVTWDGLKKREVTEMVVQKLVIVQKENRECHRLHRKKVIVQICRGAAREYTLWVGGSVCLWLDLKRQSSPLMKEIPYLWISSQSQLERRIYSVG